MVRDPTLRIIVRSNPLAAITASNEALASRANLGMLLRLSLLEDSGFENLEGTIFIF